MNQSKSKKKSTKGAKNWRKNIDVSQAENVRVKKLQEKVEEDQIKFTKDEDLFEVDNKVEELPKGFLRRKIKNDELENQRLKALEKKGYNRIITRKAQNIEQNLNNNIAEKKPYTQIKKEEKKVTENKDLNEVTDLWGDSSNNNKKTIKLSHKTPITLPRISLPHPGLSYNPTVEDSKNLMTTVANLNKEVLIKPSLLNEEIEEEYMNNLALKETENKSKSKNKTKKQEDSDSESEGIQEITNNKKKTNKLTRTQLNKKHKSRMNQLKNEKEHLKKLNRIEIDNIKSAKNFERIQEENIKETNKALKKEELKKKNQENMKRLGAYIE